MNSNKQNSKEYECNEKVKWNVSEKLKTYPTYALLDIQLVKYDCMKKKWITWPLSLKESSGSNFMWGLYLYLDNVMIINNSNDSLCR